MSRVDKSLDELIKGTGGGKGRAPGSRKPAAGARPQGISKSRRAQSSRSKGDDHLANTDVRDVAASDNPTLKVKADSKPNSVAGAICNVVRESAKGQPPAVVATGPAAINQAMKAIAIARKYLHEESVDMLVTPCFEEDLRHSSRICFELKKTRLGKEHVPSEDDLACKDTTDPYKLAGAMAGRIRDNETVACTTKGAVPVLIAVKAMALAQTYLEEEDVSVQFKVSIVDLENPEIRSDTVTSTFLHFELIAK